MLFVGEREKDSREIIGPGARRGNLYGAREGLDSPQRMRKRGSSGGSLCFCEFLYLIYVIFTDYSRNQEGSTVGYVEDSGPGPSHSRRRGASEEGTSERSRIKKGNNFGYE